MRSAEPPESPEPSEPTGSALPARQPRLLGERGRRWFDRVLTLLLLAPLPLTLGSGAGAIGVLLGVAQIAPLWWRRRHPATVLAVVVVATLAQVPLTDQPLWSQLAAPVAIYSAARFSTALVGALGLGAGLLGSVVASYDWISPYTDEITVAVLAPYAITIAAIATAAWALGTVGRTRAAYVASLLERQRRTEEAAERQVELAAAEERTRIARELHDVVAHGLSVIVVQADGARYAARRDPEVAAATLGTIAATGREALADMRRMLGILRSGETGTSPVPGLADVGDLLEPLDGAGAGTEHDLHGLEQQVPAVVGLTVYRVVQESLTNVRRHAGPDAHARVRVRVEPAEVRVEVRDDGRGASATSEGPGHGLAGMRERVAALDGELEAGPLPGGGWAVRARIPR